MIEVLSIEDVILCYTYSGLNEEKPDDVEYYRDIVETKHEGWQFTEKQKSWLYDIYCRVVKATAVKGKGGACDTDLDLDDDLDDLDDGFAPTAKRAKKTNG